MQNSSIAIVIVTFNGMQWIKKCLDSCATYPVIIVDNASTDGTISLVQTNYPNVTILKQTINLGFGQANNIGIRYALDQGSEYFFLLNQDAFLESNTIEKLVELVNDNPEYGIISPIHTTGDGNMLDRSFLHYIKNTVDSAIISDFILNKPKKSIYNVPMVNAAVWLLTKYTIMTVGGFDPTFFLYGEDDNYCQRVLHEKLKIGIAPNVLIRHDSQNNSSKKTISGSKRYYDNFLNRIKVVYGNVNQDRYKELGNLKLYFLKRCFIDLIKFNLQESKINFRKLTMLRKLDIKSNVLSNRIKGIKYL
jgi:GT2 family glycosyltransferase